MYTFFHTLEHVSVGMMEDNWWLSTFNKF